MKEINFYIAYLLTKHECVVIPDFGAFVVSSVPVSKKEATENFSPPFQFLGFNSEIKHNDGLLTHFLSVMEKISYKEADWLIKQHVERLHEQLHNRRTVSIKWLGELSLASGNKIIFMPDARLSCNATNFGFENLDLFSLKELSAQEKEKKELITISINRRMIVRTGSVAAAILALLFSSAPLNNSGRYTQNASFFMALHDFEVQKTKNETIALETIALTDTILTPPADTIPMPTISETVLPQSPKKIVEKTNTGNYYIIVASLSTKDQAKDKLSDLKKDGFPQAAVISNINKHRIYIKRFEKKAEAESYLQTFRRANPQYTDAWLLAQKD